MVHRDVLCGRIQCQGGNDRPLLGSNAEILTTKVRLNHSDFTCRGTFFDLGDDVSDPAMVTQGTSCGQGKVGIRSCIIWHLTSPKMHEILKYGS